MYRFNSFLLNSYNLEVLQLTLDCVCWPKVGISSGKLTVGAESQCHTGCDNVTGSALDVVSVIPTGPSTPAISEDPTYAAIPKSDGWSRNAKLRQFWADGMGRPHPLSYHPDVEVAHQRGLADFKRAEDEYIEKNCPSEESLQVQIPPPVCPLKPRMPGLYYLKEIGAEVDLPWTWECSSGDKFVEKWELSLMCTDFKLKLMRCVYWWTCRKVSNRFLLALFISFLTFSEFSDHLTAE